MEPFVPERDHRIGSNQRPSPPPPQKKPKDLPPPPPPRSTGGGVGAGLKILVAILLVTSIALVGMNLMLVNSVATLQQQFDDLQGKIDSTDESLNQSGTTLSLKIREQEEKLAEHWTEIRKLWGISYDTNRKAIADNTKAIDGFKTSIANIQAGLKKTETSLAAIQQSVATASKQAEESSKGVAAIRNSTLGAAAQVDELRDKVNKMSESLATTNTTVNQLRTDLTRRVGENEQAIRAMDSYRSQINQQLNQLRQQLGGAP